MRARAEELYHAATALHPAIRASRGLAPAPCIGPAAPGDLRGSRLLLLEVQELLQQVGQGGGEGEVEGQELVVGVGVEADVQTMRPRREANVDAADGNHGRCYRVPN